MKNFGVPVILKIVSLVLLFIVTVVGCNAHFQSVWLDLWKAGLKDICDSIILYDCPYYATPMERTFVAFTIICLILSAASLVAGFLVDLSKFKVIDAGYHGLAGFVIFISGILLIVAAVKIDDVVTSLYPGSSLLKDLRKELKYADKLAAGAMAIINGILYFVTAGAIFKS